MTDDKGAGGEMQAQAGICKHCLDDHEGDDCVGYARSQGYIAGRKAEREKNWKTVADLCGVNPWDNRPCIAKVEKMFWCPVCKCADKIRGGQDGK